MKKIILTSGLAILTLLQVASAQDNKVKNKENDKEKDKEKKVQEITIKRIGDKDTKVVIEIKDGNILINGKPVSEYKDGDLKISSHSMNGLMDGHDFVFTPGGANSIFRSWDGGEKRAFLGVTTEAADGGAKVTDVVEGSAAAKAGIKEGDVITAIDETKVTDPDGVLQAVTAHKPKDEVKVQYQRNGKSAETKVALGENQNFARPFFFNGDHDGFGGNFLNDLKENKLFAPNTPGLPKTLRMYGGGPKLGARVEDADNDGGAKTTKIEEGSAAEKAGLKAEDVITELNGNKVKNVQDVREELMDVKDKSSYNIKIKRGGAEMNFEIKVPKKVNKADI